ncbi:3-hydroxyacyl-CoA dehydrogenase/enoyl-CoA hydratase family protein [Corynebacterium doosanense]|uniref:3-hydroxyacyl-CoA dehydrogenase n=1 Tax=Corynebacterium doosanense CAU 212 = DSM 45436 TaxID=558173 RepID=A0A097IER6_9CORY|nr:3-hydroxyacyl-CoA dehydrogenase/enoyl-CoA hydratase family protein [Corynebacterium doosanense]AIT60618.1 3-hydroxyacyl-CoA dehydrogenase [Corynebacterium doosanense CAU 212 = DSM 45436]
MSKTITKAAVIGAGSMGAGIAAHLANSGCEVVLLDVSTELAEKGLERQLKSRGFLHPDFAKRVRTGTIEDDLSLLSDAEWIVEAILENPKIKQDTYAKINEVRAEGSFLSSNTSTIPLATLTEGMTREQAADFAITHFFNPPRVMPLVEIVRSEAMSDERLADLKSIVEVQLGKSVIDCRDTPGFVANRTGNYWMSVGAQTALDRGLDIELADAAFGKPVGVPRTGVFGLFDYIGIQIVPSIWDSFLGTLSKDDAFQKYDLPRERVFAWLLENGFTGRTGPSGFYRGREEALDPETLEYRPRREVTDPVAQAKNISEAIAVDSEGGRYVWDVFAETLEYCAVTAPEIADTVADIDGGFVLGYSWKKGPFALADEIGMDTLLERWRADGREVPALLEAAEREGGFYPAEGKVLSSEGEVVEIAQREDIVRVADLAKDEDTVVAFENEGAVLYKLSDGVGVFSLKTPMGAFDEHALAAVEKVAADYESLGLTALVIANDNPKAFSAGAFLPLLAGRSSAGDEEGLREVVLSGNKGFRGLSEASIPVVSAARGVALGGGAEMLVHSDRVVAHAETSIGFPERLVGLYPAWGGATTILARAVAAGVENPHQVAFDIIMDGKPVENAYRASERFLLQDDDVIVMNSDLVLARALEEARAMVGNYTAQTPTTVPLYSPGAEPLNKAWLGDDVAEADRRIGAELADLYTGVSEISSDELEAQEVDAGVRLLLHPKNVARAQHMEKYRRPLKDS